MSSDDIFESFFFLGKQKRVAVWKRAMRQYAKLLSSIAEDIYSSCIGDYYDQYDPKVYDRHGYPEGKNLYSAIHSWAEDAAGGVSMQGSRLLPYKGKRDKRDKVLDSVLDGWRGAGSSKTPPGWPMEWYTHYPNKFSKYKNWSSDETVLMNILEDFMQNGPEDLTDEFLSLLKSNM